MSGSSGIGYLELLRSNSNYRRIWLGDVASLLGDWFNTIALYTLVRGLTGSPLALGLVFITKMLPWALASPFAGLLNDRFNRRRLMIGSDIVRALIVLGFLAVNEAGDVPLLYVLSAAQVAVGAVFIPARSASIPNITSERELLTANALSAVTWSTLLAVGAALGGFVTQWLGIQAVFVLDSFSYLVSAYFIFRAEIPQDTPVEPASGSGLEAAWEEIADGWRHLRSHPHIARMIAAKPAWGIGGSGLVFMLALLGEQMTAAPAVGIGLLFGARGLGTGLGPIAVRAWLPDEDKWPVMLGVGIVATGVAYLAIGLMPWTAWMVLLVIVAHAPSGANWVSSTVLLQRRTVDRYRGRIFSTEWLLITLVDAVSILVVSLVMEAGFLDLRSGLVLFAILEVLVGVAWLAIVPRRERAWERAQ